MSRRLFPMIIPLEEPQPGTLHLIPEGAKKCVHCDTSRYAQRVRYTDDAELYNAVAWMPSVAMVDPIDEMCIPMRCCLLYAKEASSEANNSTKH